MTIEQAKPTASDAYLLAHAEAQELAKQVSERLFDLPAPDGEQTIDWGHVGTVHEVKRQLVEILSFLNS